MKFRIACLIHICRSTIVSAVYSLTTMVAVWVNKPIYFISLHLLKFFLTKETKEEFFDFCHEYDYQREKKKNPKLYPHATYKEGLKAYRERKAKKETIG